MKKIAEKVVLVAQICITLVFVLTTILYMTGVLAFTNANGQATNSVTLILMIVLAVVYVALSAYMLYVNFAERESLKRILLFADCDSSTRTNIKVLKNVVKGCENKVDGINVRKMRVRTDEKGGLVAIFNVKVSADNVAQSINDLRLLLVDSFHETFGLTFNTINFEIDKLNGKYQPNSKTNDSDETNAETPEETTENDAPNEDEQNTTANNLVEPQTEQTEPTADTAKTENEQTKETEKEKV